MTKIITVGGIKGGSGKTTIATNLAVCLSRTGQEILLVDTDLQQTATEFTICRQETKAGHTGYTAIKLTGPSVSREVLKLKDKYQYIIIDAGGTDTGSQRHALLVCDLYIVPMNPRSFDIWTIPNVAELVSMARAGRTTDFKAYCFINRADARGSDNKEAADALMQVDGIEFIPVAIGNRKAFANASAQGLGVIELQDEKAIQEIESLFEVITKVPEYDTH